jgi:hypothetical protein
MKKIICVLCVFLTAHSVFSEVNLRNYLPRQLVNDTDGMMARRFWFGHRYDRFRSVNYSIDDFIMDFLVLYRPPPDDGRRYTRTNRARDSDLRTWRARLSEISPGGYQNYIMRDGIHTRYLIIVRLTRNDQRTQGNTPDYVALVFWDEGAFAPDFGDLYYQ